MTAPDQTEAAERSARELERRLRLILPPSHLADAYAFAMAFKRWEMERDWRCWPPSPPVITAKQPGVPADKYATDLAAAREACETASDKHHRKEDHA